MKAYISTGLVAETILALEKIQSLDCKDTDVLSSVRITYGIKLSDALTFAQRLGWISTEEQRIIFTKQGEAILSEFEIHYCRSLEKNIASIYLHMQADLD